MKGADLERVIDAILNRRKRLAVFFDGPDCCIGAAAVAVDVLRHFGFDAKPLAVSALVKKGESSRLIGFTGIDHGPGMVDIHLVVMVEGQLLDLTIESASEMQNQIDISSVFLRASEIPDEFDRTRKIATIDVDGHVVRYASFPDDRSYLDSSHWTDKALRRRLVRTIISDVENKDETSGC